MYIQRNIDIELEKWKYEINHKPLLIRGARQVGKTKTIREFGKKFENLIEINFEESPRLKKLFSDDLSPLTICENIAAIFKTSIIHKKEFIGILENTGNQAVIVSWKEGTGRMVVVSI